MYLSVLFYVFYGDGFEHVGLIVEERETPQPGGGEGCKAFGIQVEALEGYFQEEYQGGGRGVVHGFIWEVYIK